MFLTSLSSTCLAISPVRVASSEESVDGECEEKGDNQHPDHHQVNLAMKVGWIGLDGLVSPGGIWLKKGAINV